ncbi:uncharacterized protein MONBRDRAFT_11008 [Monosiga brevicollis MX1]|uniref:Uncharacterized protein n=1 Tax=Monosiga brevicollis TaxID=81824 RepID=A9V7X8_MONBE|nr:uncharacterized protein MONBRDRAFT_11008 [Monosiga brevicollis MX1]EDQ86381.1 predicted protein [Monosiga brevicollis MX1]|eukprot:XP_001748771.1 hypothetical protein [Monosiga brevicollis MX1]
MAAKFQVLNEEGKNRHRFLSFADQLKRIQNEAIRPLHQVFEEVTEDTTTFFDEALDKWRELNLTSHFESFTRDVRGLSGSLPLLVHHQGKLIDALLHHLTVPKSRALDALLDLTVQLARDLRDEFYQHFDRVFETMLQLLNPSSREDLESNLVKHAFTTLSFLFKFLRAYIVKDLDYFFQTYYHRLLGADSRPFLRQFAAESYAFLLRKVGPERFPDHLKVVFQHVYLQDDAQLAEGVGLTLFELLGTYTTSAHGNEPLQAHVVTALRACFQGILKHVSADVWRNLSQLVLGRAATLRQQLANKPTSRQLAFHLFRLCDVLRTCVHANARSTVVTVTALARLVMDLLETRTSTLQLRAALHLLQGLTLCHPREMAELELWQQTAPVLLQHDRPMLEAEFILDWVEGLWHSRAALALVKQPVADFCGGLIAANARQPITFLTLLGHICEGHDLSLDLRLAPKAEEACFTLLLRAAAALQQQPDLIHERDAQIGDLWICLRVLAQAHDHNDDAKAPLSENRRAQLDTVCKILARHLGAPSTQASRQASGSGVVDLLDGPAMQVEGYACLAAALLLWWRGGAREAPDEALVDWLLQLLGRHGASEALLQAAEIILGDIQATHPGLLSTERLFRLLGRTQKFLSHSLGKQRLLLLRIFGHFEQPQWPNKETKEPCLILERCLEVESIPADVKRHRERRVVLGRLAEQARELPEPVHLAVLHYLFGQYRVNFSLLWADAKAALQVQAGLAPELFWRVARDQQQAVAVLTRTVTTQSLSLLKRGVDVYGQANGVNTKAFASHLEHSVALEGLALALLGRQWLHALAPALHNNLAHLRTGHVPEDAPTPGSSPASFRQLPMTVLQTLEQLAHTEDRVDLTKLQQLVLETLASAPQLVQQHAEPLASDFVQLFTSEYDAVFAGEQRFQDISDQNDALAGIIQAVQPASDEDEDELDTAQADEKEDDLLEDLDTMALRSRSSKAPPAQTATDAASNSPTVPDGDAEAEQEGDASEEPTADAPPRRKEALHGKPVEAVVRQCVFRCMSVRKKVVLASITQFLQLFAVLKRGDALPMSAELQDAFLQVLQRPEEDMQEHALTALYIFKSFRVNVKPYHQQLTLVIRSHRAKLREILQKFNIESQDGVLKAEHRDACIATLHRILLAKMFARRGRSKQYNPRDQRRLVLRYLQGSTQEELLDFVRLVTRPIEDNVDNVLSAEAATTQNSAVDVTRAPPLKRQLGFMAFVTDLVQVLGAHLAPFLPHVMQMLLGILQTTDSLLAQRDLIARRHVAVLKSVRREGLRRIVLIYQTFQRRLLVDYDRDIDRILVSPHLDSFVAEQLQRPSPLMELFTLWSELPTLVDLFTAYNQAVLPTMWAVLSHPHAKPSAVAAVLTVIDNLLPTHDDLKRAKRFERRTADAQNGVTKSDANDADSDGEAADVVEQYRAGVKVEEEEFMRELAAKRAVMTDHVSSLLAHMAAYIFNKYADSAPADTMDETGDSALPSTDPTTAAVASNTALAGVEEDEDDNEDAAEANTDASVPSASNTAVGKTRLKRFAPLDLSILSRLAPFATDADQAVALTRLLMSQLLLPDRLLRVPSKVHILRFALHAFDLFGHAHGHLAALAQVLERSDSAQLRSLAAECIVAGAKFEDMVDVAPVAADVLALQALDGTAAGEVPDYEARVSAFERLRARLETKDVTLSAPALQLLVQGTSHMLCSDDFTLRSIAATLFELLSATAERNPEFYPVLIEGPCLRVLKRGVRADSDAARQQALQLLARLSSMFATTPRFAVLQPLRHHDEEQDFFANMVHIQRIRRIKALTTLQAYLQEHQSSLADDDVATEDTEADAFLQDMLTGFFVPACAHYVFEATKVQESNLVLAATDTIGAMARVLPWSAYAQLLRSYIDQASRKPDLIKTLLRVAVAVLDAFHFDVSDAMVEVEAPAKSNVAASGTGATKATAEAHEADQDDDDEIYTSRQMRSNRTRTGGLTSRNPVLQGLLRVFIPKLNRLLAYKDEEGHDLVRSPVARALVRLFLNLPDQVLRAQLPHVLLKLVAMLRHRHNSLRDEARRVFVDVSVMLGPAYLQALVKELKDGLTRGYQRHVLSYTLHQVLHALQPSFAPGDVDACLDPVMEVVMDDILGLAGEEKDSDEIPNRIKEAKKSNCYETAAVMATFISPGMTIMLLAPIENAMAVTESSRIVNKLRELLRTMGRGLENNAAFTVETSLKLAHYLVRRYLPLSKQGAVKVKDKQLRPESIFIVPPRPSGPQGPQVYFNTNAHLMVALGLQMLLAAFRHNQLDATNEEQLGMLDPFTPLLVDCLFSMHTRILSLTCRIWSHFIVLHGALPSMTKVVPKLTSRMIKLMHRTGESNASTELVQSCAKALGVVLRDVNSAKLSDNQLEVLLSFIREDLETVERQTTAFGLLRTIVTRKLMHPEVYTVMDRVGSVLVQSQSTASRNLACQAFVAFLLNYPLAKKRLVHHLRFLASNLNYEFDTGRLSVVTTLHEVVRRLPDNMVHEYQETFLLPLVQLIASSDVAHTRQVAQLALRALLDRLPHAEQDKICEMANLWLQSEKPALQVAGWQVTSLLIDVYDTRFRTFAPRVIEHAMAVFANAVDEDTDEETDDMQGQDTWQLLYLSLTVLHKLAGSLESVKQTLLSNAELGRHLKSLLGYSHAWVRLASAQCIGGLLANLAPGAVAASVLGDASSTNNKKAVSALGLTTMMEVYDLTYEVRQMVRQLIDLCQHVCGYDMTTMLDEARQTVAAKRQKRKNRENQMQIVNPQAAAARKVKRNLAKRATRRRQVERFKQKSFGGKSVDGIVQAKRAKKHS